MIPNRPAHPFTLAFALIPMVMLFAFGPPVWEFFDRTRTPLPVAIWFLGLLTFMFGVLPATAVANGYIRSRFGHTDVQVTQDGIHIQQRGAWRTHTLATLEASEILDVDYGTRDSGAVSARRAAKQQLMQAGRQAESVNPRVERLVAAATRWTKGRGVIVKSRGGLTSFGQDLADDEIEYLYGLVRQTLIGRAIRTLR